MKKISIIALLGIIILPETVKAANSTEQPMIKSGVIYSNPETVFPHGLQIGVGVSGTGGLNTFIGYNNKKFDSFWWKRLGIRFDFATMSPVKGVFKNGINKYAGDDGIKIYDGLKINNVNMDANHFGAMIDFYPFGDTWLVGGWRISGGYFTGKLDLDANIKANKDIEFELGGRKYQYTGGEMHGTSTVNWKYNGPYVGTGFDLGLIAGLKVYVDAGVVFANNRAQVGLDAPLTSDLKDITSGMPQDIQGEIENKYNEAKAKALSDAQKELDKYSTFPLVKVGFMYRF